MMDYGLMHGWGGLGSSRIVGGLSMFLMGIVPLLLLAAVVWLVVETVRRGRGPALSGYPAAPVLPPQPEAVPAVNARSMLDERYARGELHRETYLQMRQDLDSV